MNKNQVEGAAKNTAGKVQQKIGEVIGNQSQQAKGVVKQIQGTIQKGAGNVEQVLKDTAAKAGNKR
jgi:uncharacterized protein YjbJ (UPF0337 family)